MRKLVIVITILAITGIARAATVQVTWNPNTEEDLAGYRLYYGAASGTGDQVHVIGIATSANTILLKMIDIGEVQ